MEEQPNVKKTTSPVDKLWEALASIKLAIYCFSLIALTSVAGTLLEQTPNPENNIKLLASVVGEANAPGAYRILDAMGFMDMYSSWWFLLLLGIFAANIIICSIDRFPPVWRAVRDKQKPLKDDQFRIFPIRDEFALKGSAEDIQTRVRAGLRKLGFKKTEAVEDGDGSWQIFSQKQPLSRVGVYITHISIVIIMIGAVAGVLFGFKGYLNLPEGWLYPMAFGTKALPNELYQERGVLIDALMKTKGDMAAAAQRLNVPEDQLSARMRYLQIQPLPFSVGCEDFEVDFYGSSDMAKEFRSLLTVSENGQTVKKQWIEVNTPLRYKGYTFYQSSYGKMDDPADYIFKLRVTPAGGSDEAVNVKLGESFTIADTGIEVSLIDFSPAIRMDQSGNYFTYNNEMMNNPAVRVRIKEPDAEYTRWIIKRYPNSGRISNGHSIVMLDAWGGQFTGLQVRRDPGVWIVYLGCFLMSTGLYMAFFMSHRRIWVRVVPGKGAARVTVAATAHKGREGFERHVREMINLLSSEGGK